MQPQLGELMTRFQPTWPLRFNGSTLTVGGLRPAIGEKKEGRRVVAQQLSPRGIAARTEFSGHWEEGLDLKMFMGSSRGPLDEIVSPGVSEMARW